MRAEIKLIIPVLFALFFCTGTAFALTPTDLVWNGSMNVYLTNNSFSADQNISGYIWINNTENFPLIDGKVVLQLVQLGPNTQMENIVLEDTIGEIWALPSSSKRIDFSLPKQSAGEYRLDVYSWVTKARFVGASNILVSPISTMLDVQGNAGAGNAVILRNETSFGTEAIKQTNQDGFPATPGTQITGHIFVKNDSSVQKSNLKLEVSLCDWAAAFCDNPSYTFVDVPSIASGETKDVIANITAPKTPSAYEINIRLVSDKGVESIYKNRVITSGGTAKLRKIFIDGLATGSYRLGFIYSGSPDHFANPDFNNFNILEELSKSGNIIESNSINSNNIFAGEIQSASFDIKSKNFDKVCLRIVKDAVIYEEKCFSAPITEIQKAYDETTPAAVKVSWNYNEQAALLKVILEKKNINAIIKVISTDGTLAEETITAQDSAVRNFNLPKKDMTLIVDDLNAKKQQVIELNLITTDEKIASALNDTNGANSVSCNANICNVDETCVGTSFESAQGLCCANACVPQTSQSGIKSQTPFIFWIAIILVIIAIFVVYSAVRVVKK